ncbi:MAG TPA: hypothetical protein VGI10_06275 [Polyangiaceae bacterium]|jgi:hypothetical protein
MRGPLGGGLLVSASAIAPPGIPLSGLLEPIDPSWLWDNQAFTAAGVAPNQYIQTNYYAYTKYQVTGPQAFVVQSVPATGAVAALRNTVDIMLDGTYDASLTFTVDATKQTQIYNVPAGVHTIEVLAGQETYVTAVQGVGRILLPTPVQKRITLCGASGTYGYNPLGMVASKSWYGRLRQLATFGGGFNLSQSGFSLYNWIGLGIPNFILNTLAPCMTGAIENDFYFETDAGTFFQALKTPTEYATDLAATFTAMRTAFPALRMHFQTRIFLNDGGAPNGLGFTLAQYAAASTGVVNGRTDVSLIDGLLMGTTVADLSFDNRHEIQGVDSPAPGTGYAKAFRCVRQNISNQCQAPSVVNVTTQLKITNPAATPPSILGPTTQAWWRSDAGITIGTTPNATGTAPPAVTWAGSRLRQDVLVLKISTPGTGAAAKFDVYQDGGTVPVASAIPCAASVTILNATTTPMVVTFPNQAYAADNVYNSTVESWLDNLVGAHLLLAPSIAAQPLLTLEANGQRGVKARLVAGVPTSELNCTTVTFPINTVTGTFISAITRTDTWITGTRFFGGLGGAGGFFVTFDNGGSPNASGYCGTIAPAGGQAGLTVGQIKRLEIYSGGVGADYLRTGGTDSGAVLNFGATGAPVTNFNLFKSLPASFFGAKTFQEVTISQTDPGATKRTALGVYYGARYGAGVNT